MKEVCSIARADSEKNSKSNAKRRQFSIQEKVLSTILRFCKTWNFFEDSSGLNTTERFHPYCFVDCAKSSPLYSPSARIFLSPGYLYARFSNTVFAPTPSKILAA